MFEPDLSQYAWGSELSEAAMRGPDEALRFARRVRPTLGDDEADDVAEQLVELLDLRLDPPGQLGSLVAAAGAFAGPRTVSRVGEVLRRDLEGAAWKVERGLELLERNRSRETAIQLSLCARDAHEFAVLHRARELFRGYTSAWRDLLTVGDVEVPSDHLLRYFALNLEKAMLEGARFKAAELSAAVLSPAREALGRVVWARYEGRRVADVFMLDPDGAGFVDDDWNAVQLEATDILGVPHPAELTPAQRDAWGIAFADNELVGLFEQLDREVMVASPTFPYRAIDRDVRHWELARFLHRHGWERERESRFFELKFRGVVLALETRREQGDLRKLISIQLRRHKLTRTSAEDDVVFSEGISATVELLEAFAPELI